MPNRQVANLKLRTILGIVLGVTTAITPLRGDDLSHSEPRLIDLNVIAVDRQGLPVTDLTSDDFRVTDAGKEQRIAFFHHTDTSRWKMQQPLGPHEFSNRGGSQIPYATVILFDLMNEGFGSRGYAQNEIVRALESMETADYLYFYVLTVDGQLLVAHGLPAVTTREPWTRQIKPLMDQVMRSATKIRLYDIDVAVRVQLTFEALETLATELSRVPGRKNIVWITDGVPIALGPERSDTGDFVDFTPELRKLSEALDESGVAVYPVRQVLFGAPDSIGFTSGNGETGGAGTGIESVATLNALAGMTGGRPTMGRDIGVALKQAMNDVRSSYQMGYYPPEGNWNNKFHNLRVTCMRKGVRIQAKTGYYAWTAPPGTRAREAFEMAASTAFDAAEIGLRASVSSDPKDGRVTRFNLSIDANDIVFVSEGNDYVAQLRIAVVHYLTNGQSEIEPIIPLDVQYSTQQRLEALESGIEFSGNAPNGKSGTQFRVIVFDRDSNAVGAVTIPDYETSGAALPQLSPN